MSIELPDVNVLLALLDPMHPHHDRANSWYDGIGEAGWATCPLTQNGFLRILTGASYPGIRLRMEDAMALLDTAFVNPSAKHHFWGDLVSIQDETLFSRSVIAGPKQITDVYLLGLCQQNGGTLVTFDTRITVNAIALPHAKLLRIL